MAAPSHHPGDGEHLKEFWAYGKGAAKIRWNTPGDFERCVHHLGRYVADPEGLCNVLHQMATGAPPGNAPGDHA